MSALIKRLIDQIDLWSNDFPELYEGEFSYLNDDEKKTLAKIKNKHAFTTSNYVELFELEQKMAHKEKDETRKQILDHILKKLDFIYPNVDFSEIESAIDANTITYDKMKKYVGDIKRKITQPETPDQQRKRELLEELAQMRNEYPTSDKEITSLEDYLKQSAGVSEESYVDYRALIDSLKNVDSNSPEGQRKAGYLKELNEMRSDCPELDPEISRIEKKLKSVGVFENKKLDDSSTLEPIQTVGSAPNESVVKRIQEFLGGNAKAENDLHNLVALLGEKINNYLRKTRSYRKISEERKNEVSAQINKLLIKGFDDPSKLTMQDVEALIQIHEKNKERMWKVFRILGGKTRRKRRSQQMKSRKRKRTLKPKYAKSFLKNIT
jgi:hypothetical protein